MTLLPVGRAGLEAAALRAPDDGVEPRSMREQVLDRDRPRLRRLGENRTGLARIMGQL
jgi:hypothetical protein